MAPQLAASFVFKKKDRLTALSKFRLSDLARQRLSAERVPAFGGAVKLPRGLHNRRRTQPPSQAQQKQEPLS
jgi:hypothetical protein